MVPDMSALGTEELENSERLLKNDKQFQRLQAQIAIIRISFRIHLTKLSETIAPKHSSLGGRSKRFQCFPRSVEDAFEF